MVKNPPANAGDTGDSGLISGSGRSPGEGDGTPLQYSCLENPMGRGAWRPTVHRVTKSLTQPSDRTTCAGRWGCESKETTSSVHLLREVFPNSLHKYLEKDRSKSRLCGA